MAEVYLARRRAGGIEKLFVVKRIRPEREGDVRFLDLFVREARLSMGLAHQNIVHVFDFGRSGDQVFLALEHVEGRDLGATLQRAGRDRRLPPVLAAYIAAECCQALDYAHQRKRDDGTRLGVVHRDVTPRNVLVSWSGEVKLTDFGIAALAGDETTTLIGTPAYMAPEMILGRDDVDRRADVYAIGCVAFYLLTGTRVFQDGNQMQVLVDHVHAEPVPPSSRLGRPLPREVDVLVLDCLRKNPGDRPKDAGELLVRIASCRLAGEWSGTHARTWWQARLPELAAPLGAGAA
jgi:serine/threonine protein kinase